MDRERRGVRPLVAAACAAALLACGDETLRAVGDAAVDVGEALRDASCALAQEDGGACAPAHGSVDVVCDLEARWVGSERTGSAQPSQHVISYALVDVPVRAAFVEHCPDEPQQTHCRNIPDVGLTCESGAPPPATSCWLTPLVFAENGQAYVECGSGSGSIDDPQPEPGNLTYPRRVIW